MTNSAPRPGQLTGFHGDEITVEVKKGFYETVYSRWETGMIVRSDERGVLIVPTSRGRQIRVLVRPEALAEELEYDLTYRMRWVGEQLAAGRRFHFDDGAEAALNSCAATLAQEWERGR